jgi:hypothetical protein
MYGKHKGDRRSDYAAKLRDPRWQKKRLEILDFDSFTRQECGDATTTLHVHHRYYQFGRDPWDYPKSALATLCESCHAEARAEPLNPVHVIALLMWDMEQRGVTLNDLEQDTPAARHLKMAWKGAA